MPAIFIIFIVAAFIAIIIYSVYAAAQRRKELSAWAAGNSLSFDESKDDGFEDRYPQYTCLQQGSNRYAYNRMSGQMGGREVLAFDYHYETHSTDSKGHQQTDHHYFSAVIVASGLPLKPLVIRPEGFFDKLKSFFGYEDINFESAEFSKRFYVASPDRKWAYDVIHQRTMEFLQAAPRFNIQMDAADVMVHGSGTFSTQQFQAAVDVVCGILDRLPDYVKQQQIAVG